MDSVTKDTKRFKRCNSLEFNPIPFAAAYMFAAGFRVLQVNDSIFVPIRQGILSVM